MALFATQPQKLLFVDDRDGHFFRLGQLAAGLLARDQRCRLLAHSRPHLGANGCATATANACNPAVLNGLTARNTIGFSNTSAAAFGKLTWHISDAFSIAPGLRVNYDKKSGSYVSVVTIGSGSTTLNDDQRGVLIRSD